MKSDYWRQLDFYDPKMDNNDILIIGAGSIGSYVAFGLARLGVKKMTIVDHDVVEAHNLPNQFFSEELVVKAEDKSELAKVIATMSTISMIVKGCTITPYAEKIETVDIDINNFDAIFVCVDDMDVRKWIWKKLKDGGILNFGDCLIVDPRTGGEYANIFSIKTSDVFAVSYYEENLWSNDEASKLPCSGQSIVDVSMNVAASCVQRYRKWTKNNLAALHTFHDYSLGTVGFVQYYDRSATITGKIRNVEKVVDVESEVEADG